MVLISKGSDPSSNTAGQDDVTLALSVMLLMSLPQCLHIVTFPCKYDAMHVLFVSYYGFGYIEKISHTVLAY